MPFRVTEYYTQVIEAQAEPYRSELVNIVIPPDGKPAFAGRFDPYGNVDVRVEQDFLQHKYENTGLVHIVDACISACQFCYKVEQIRDEGTGTTKTVERARTVIPYIREHNEIDNILLTGGDPAVLPTKILTEVIATLLQPEHVRTLRFATKGLAFHPQRFLDEELLKFIDAINRKGDKRIKVVSQYNHPAELTKESMTALRALQQVGVQVYGQPVVLRGVNDAVSTLVDLQNRFLHNNVVSYYLVTFMPVKGVEQYALPLEKAYQLVAESKSQLSGLAKKGMLIAPHDWGKLEICGFLPNAVEPKQIVLKWHERAMPQYLPPPFKNVKQEEVMILDFEPGKLYCADHVFAYNNLPFL